MIAALAKTTPLPVADGQLSDFVSILKMLVEVAVFAAVIYVGLRFLRETRGSGIVRGLALLLAMTLIGFVILIKALQLDRLGWVLREIAPSLVLGLVVVFHPEIRRAIEREASLSELTENGITIDAELNSYLLESIFFPKSALHDGGVVVRDDRIVAASCLFPLSQNPDVDKRLGTRHRAALGLSEETDALVLVVSEETGKISTASGGKLNFDLTLEQLEQQLDDMLTRKLAA